MATSYPQFGETDRELDVSVTRNDSLPLQLALNLAKIDGYGLTRIQMLGTLSINSA